MKRLTAYLHQLGAQLLAVLRLTWQVCCRYPEDILRYGLRNAVDNQLERDRDQLVDRLVRHLWPPIPPQLPPGWAGGATADEFAAAISRGLDEIADALDPGNDRPRGPRPGDPGMCVYPPTRRRPWLDVGPGHVP